MKRATGNQYASRKREAMKYLGLARDWLKGSDETRSLGVFMAQCNLRWWQEIVDSVPASTRRRWRCGH